MGVLNKISERSFFLLPRRHKRSYLHSSGSENIFRKYIMHSKFAVTYDEDNDTAMHFYVAAVWLYQCFYLRPYLYTTQTHTHTIRISHAFDCNFCSNVHKQMLCQLWRLPLKNMKHSSFNDILLLKTYLNAGTNGRLRVYGNSIQYTPRRKLPNRMHALDNCVLFYTRNTHSHTDIQREKLEVIAVGPTVLIWPRTVLIQLWCKIERRGGGRVLNAERISSAMHKNYLFGALAASECIRKLNGKRSTDVHDAGA